MPLVERHESKDLDFRIAKNGDGTWSIAQIQAAVLMDIRDELQRLNALLHCHNFTGIPTTLRSIRRAMRKPRTKRR